MIDCVVYDFVVDCIIGWCSDRLYDGLIVWLVWWSIDCMINWLYDGLMVWLIDCMIDLWLIVWWIDSDGLIMWLIAILVLWLIGWLNNPFSNDLMDLAGLLMHGPVGWLASSIACLAVTWIDWSIDWLIRWVACSTKTGQGWGITTDGTSLIVSDGSDYLYFWDPETMEETRRVKVRARSVCWYLNVAGAPRTALDCIWLLWHLLYYGTVAAQWVPGVKSSPWLSRNRG